jgi:hypothetical protein
VPSQELSVKKGPGNIPAKNCLENKSRLLSLADEFPPKYGEEQTVFMVCLLVSLAGNGIAHERIIHYWLLIDVPWSKYYRREVKKGQVKT